MKRQGCRLIKPSVKGKFKPQKTKFRPLPKETVQPKGMYNILIVNGKVRNSETFPWIDYCLEYIERFTTSPHKIHIFDYTNSNFPGTNVVRPGKSFADFIDSKYPKKKVGGRKYVAFQHQAGMSYLASLIKSGWIITLDSDSLPVVKGWEKSMSNLAGSKGMVGAKRRIGGLFGRIAHPACLCMSAWTYKHLKTDFFRKGRSGDTAAKLTRSATFRKCRVRLLARSNDFPKLKKLTGSGPSLFSVHGNLVYHHGCGSRMSSKGPVHSRGRKNWSPWILALHEHIKKLVATNHKKFISFVKAGKWPL